jgi:hypothetical protein
MLLTSVPYLPLLPVISPHRFLTEINYYFSLSHPPVSPVTYHCFSHLVPCNIPSAARHGNLAMLTAVCPPTKLNVFWVSFSFIFLILHLLFLSIHISLKKKIAAFQKKLIFFHFYTNDKTLLFCSYYWFICSYLFWESMFMLWTIPTIPMSLSRRVHFLESKPVWWRLLSIARS